jgi:hypothetical protein
MSQNEKPAKDLRERPLETVVRGVDGAPPRTPPKVRFEDILMSCVPGPDWPLETPPRRQM